MWILSSYLSQQSAACLSSFPFEGMLAIVYLRNQWWTYWCHGYHCLSAYSQLLWSLREVQTSKKLQYKALTSLTPNVWLYSHQDLVTPKPITIVTYVGLQPSVKLRRGFKAVVVFPAFSSNSWPFSGIISTHWRLTRQWQLLVYNIHPLTLSTSGTSW